MLAKVNKRIFYGVLVVMVLLGAAACSPKGPTISVETVELDLGDVVNGEIITREIAVHNEGEAPLVVDSVSASCGCTTVTLEPMTIAPGESGILQIVYDSGAHGPDLTGSIVRLIFINSNDPDQPEVKIELAVNVLAPP